MRTTLQSRRLLGAAALVFGLVAGPAMTALSVADAAGAPTALPAAGRCSASGAWPEFQGDATRSGNACSSLDRSNVTQLKPAWFVGTKGAVTDTPAVNFGRVFAGDYSGTVYSVDQTTGLEQWTFDTTAPQTCFVDAASRHTDSHSAGFGQIPSSPATAVIGSHRVLYVAAGGSLYALNAETGSCLWAVDSDPGKPSNSIEIESSPLIDTAVNPPEVLIGNDDNSGAGQGVTGLMAFNAATGALLWKYEPERDLTLTPSEFGGSEALTLSCGDGSPNVYCSPARIADLAPNSTAYADACGDVWSSPALDAAYRDPGGLNTFEGSGSSAPAGWYPKRITTTGAPNALDRPDGLVVFGTGNCAANPTPATALAHGDYVDNQAIFALDPVTGVRVWNFVEPYNQYDNNRNEPGGGDTDFGSSPIVAAVPATAVKNGACPVDPTRTAADASRTSTLVIEGAKSGFAYGICAATGRDVWSVQAAQPGQLSPDFVGSIGGFLGSPSMGESNGKPTVFFTSAVPTPFTNDGLRQLNDGDSNISSCPGLSGAPLLPACPDLGILNDPQRLVSLHAVDAATGAVDYQAPSLPTYAPSTYTNGVVLLPDSTAGGVAAFDADSGNPIWAFPLAAVPASGASIAGNSIFLGTGETDGTAMGESVPPQATGIWSFSTNPGSVTITPPPAP